MPCEPFLSVLTEVVRTVDQDLIIKGLRRKILDCGIWGEHMEGLSIFNLREG